MRALRSRAPARALTLASLMLLAASPLAADEEQVAVCATPAQAKRIIATQGARPSSLLTIRDLAAQLRLNEAQVVSALPGEGTVGVAGEHFAAVWQSLAQWEDAVTLILKAGQIFEIEGPIRIGEASERGNYYNLPGGATGLGGHLRPDLLTAIYGYDLLGSRGQLRGVMFFGVGGAMAFGVFVPAEGRDASEEELAGFRRTWALLESLPALCGDGAVEGAAPGAD